jgi:pimeloyl-ACP methyl ester carboxylesterase
MNEFTPKVIALPCSGSSGSQWQSLAVTLNGRCRVLAPDLLDYAAAATVASNRDFMLLDEARPLLEIVDRAVSPIHLVGHSYGGAIALRAAVERPHRISSVALFEPTLFHLLEQSCPQDLEALRDVQQVANEVARLNALGKPEDAAAVFVDYWAGGCVWSKLRPASRESLTQYAPKATLEFNALFNEPLRLQRYAKLPVPVLIMKGEFAPAPTDRIARRLAASLPNIVHATISGVGHMAPVTHGELIAAEIANFIAVSGNSSAATSRVAA